MVATRGGKVVSIQDSFFNQMNQVYKDLNVKFYKKKTPLNRKTKVTEWKEVKLS